MFQNPIQIFFITLGVKDINVYFKQIDYAFRHLGYAYIHFRIYLTLLASSAGISSVIKNFNIRLGLEDKIILYLEQFSGFCPF